MVKDILRSVKTSLVYAELKKPLKPELVVFTSRNGKDFAGNMLRLLIEMYRRYGCKFKYVIGLEKEQISRIRKVLELNGIDGVRLVVYDSLTYQKLLERASYLFNDSTFPTRYIKRSGQVYINTWHGTPFKMMGDDSPYDNPKHRTEMDNIQRNFFASDFLLYPSRYCKDRMTGAYCLNGLYKGTILMEGYPRNSVFFDRQSRLNTITRYGLAGMTVYVYMPTFRDSRDGAKDFSSKLLLYLNRIDEKLNENEVLFVKLHYYDQWNLKKETFKHIKMFPEDIEAYEFLNACDCLITDYSSVMYDFVVSRKKIIRFCFDEESYSEERGLYPQPVEFPFPVVRSVDELVYELRSPKAYDDEAFIQSYCPYDAPDTAEKIISYIFEQKECCRTESIFDSGRKKVFFFAGALSLNGITTSAQNLLHLVDDERLYYVSYSRKMLKNHEDLLLNLPDHDGIVEIDGAYYCTFPEMLAFLLYYGAQMDLHLLRKIIDNFYKRETERVFHGMEFDSYVQFDGYGKYITGLMQHAGGRRIIFAHNDMCREIKQKKNQNYLSLRDAYKAYDAVAVVAKGLAKGIASISGRDDNIFVVNNCQNIKKIKERSDENIEVQDSTKVFNTKGQTIEEFLSSHRKIFITIGRFSKEKRHDMLIRAFCDLPADDAGLIIIGGLGDLYEQTTQLIKTTAKADDIMVIYSIMNPMPILKRADLFLLSSEYEGMPMVLFEAACLEVPIVTVDTIGCHEFMTRYNGLLLENSEEGLIKGMKMGIEGKVPLLNIDFDEYNTECVNQFDALF